MTTLGLVMIVRNEAPVIRRCLDSVRPLIDYALIADTGSSDGTQSIVGEWLREHDVPGKVVEHEWRDFGHNRNLSLAALREVPEVDYGLVIDADEYLVYEDGFDVTAFKAALSRADYYALLTHHGDYRYRRRQVFANRLAFYYKDVVHAHLVAPQGARDGGLVRGFHDFYTYDGARAADPRKFHKNAEILEEALRAASAPEDIARYTFYLAQSYRDAGVYDRALDNFLKRTTQGLWDEEVAQSYYYAAAAMERLGAPADAVIATYLRGHAVTPKRAEFLCQAARVCRQAGQYDRGLKLARHAVDLVQPDGLFVDVSVYDWRALDELQMLAYFAEDYAESVIAADRLLAEQKFPSVELKRIERNAALALAKYQGAVPA